MADKEHTEELSMESYFQNGLADDREPNNPFEPAKQERTAKKSSSKKPHFTGKLQPKRLLIVAGITAALIITIIIIVIIQKRRNDGVRIAGKIAAGLGGSVGAVQQIGGIDLHGQSAYPVLNGILPTGCFVTESPKTCKVEGVVLPEWTVVCETAEDKLSSVTYYHYEVLEDNYLGEERKSYLDPKTMPQGADVDKVESALGISPYSISYLADKTEVREYRYFFKDAETSDRTSYTITASWNAQGVLSGITDVRVDFIGTILKPRI